MKQLAFFGGVLALILVVSGCGTTGKFVPPAQMSSLVEIDSSPVSEKILAIIPFEDYRDAENSNLYFLYLIPLMPFGWGEYARPDAASMFLSLASYDTTPPEDLAKAAAVSFRHSKLFKDAFFTFGGDKASSDYVFKARLKTFKYQGKVFSYGLSVYGPLLWILGAPSGTSENQIALEFSMEDRSGKILWDWATSREDYIVQWLYARMGYDCRMFSSMFQDIMNSAILNLAKTMRDRPSDFK